MEARRTEVLRQPIGRVALANAELTGTKLGRCVPGKESGRQSN